MTKAPSTPYDIASVLSESLKNGITNFDSWKSREKSCSCISGNSKGVGNSFWQSCCESSGVFYKSLQFGRIRGIAAVVEEGDFQAGANTDYQAMISELLKRDILVAYSDCVKESLKDAGILDLDSFDLAGDGLAEFCDHLDIQPLMPLGDCVENSDFSRLLGGLAEKMSTHTGDLPVAVLLPVPDLTASEGASYSKADLVDDFIHRKRLALDWCDRYHCSLETYS